jgi:hypothetical protein
VIGPAVNQDTEPSSLAHSSHHESSEHFKGYPNLGEYKYQNAHQKSTVTTSILEMNVLMENKNSQKERVPKCHFPRKRNDCETEERETQMILADFRNVASKVS